MLAERVELVLHLGDFTEPWTTDLFDSIAPLDGVAGNNDGPELRARFGRRKVLELAGLRVGLIHGDEGRGRTTPERALNAFSGDGIDLVLFGHSHIPLLEWRGPTCLLNPGSPTDRRRHARYSYAVAELGQGRLDPALRFYDDRSPEPAAQAVAKPDA